jgi:hypothetical protein
VSARLGALSFVVITGCGSVAPGQDIQFADIIYDQNFFYCQVEPMILKEGCGSGDPSKDPASGCHFNIPVFHLTQHDPVPCTGNVPDDLSIPAAAQTNYQSASREMDPDPTRAHLLNRPTNQEAHPRQIFDIKSPQADLIRQWATKYTSQ